MSTAAQADELPNPVPTILATVGIILVLFVAINTYLYNVAQKNAPAKKPEKKLGAKQRKRETLRRGLAIPTD